MSAVYLPYSQVGDALRHVVVRTRGDPLALARAVRDEVRVLDGDARVEGLTTMQALVDRALAPWQFASGLLGGFALVALLLTDGGAPPLAGAQSPLLEKPRAPPAGVR